MRVLVTGRNGFVGGWLSRLLEDAGDSVAEVADDFDITDAAAVERLVKESQPEAVYHLAARSHVGRSWDDPAGTMEVNALGTLHLLDALRRLPEAPRTLVVSSSEVYGAVTPEELPLTEDGPVRPVSPYAASKAAAEVVALQHARGCGLPVMVARSFNHIGPGQSPTFAIPAFARRIVEAQRTGAGTLAVGNLAARRDFTDVRDVVRAYHLLMRSGRPGEVYNVCSGSTVTIGELLEQLIALSGADLSAETDPELLRPVDIEELRGDHGKLTADTGWEPQLPMSRTLADILADARAGSGD